VSEELYESKMRQLNLQKLISASQSFVILTFLIVVAKTGCIVSIASSSIAGPTIIVYYGWTGEMISDATVEITTVDYVLNASTSYRPLFYAPWLSNPVMPEVGLMGIRFLGDQGVWGQEHVIIYGIVCSVPQRISVRVEVLNYTRLLYDGIEQILVYKDEADIPVDIGLNTLWTSLKIDGNGWAYLAPRVKITSYEDDTDSTNNQALGPAIPFGPLIDARLELYVYLKEAKVPARYPEITKYAVEMKIYSDHDISSPGRLDYTISYISPLTMQEVTETKSYNVTIHRPVTIINETLIVPWTDSVKITASLYHPLDMIPQNNEQMYIFKVDEAVKILNVTMPAIVLSGQEFNVTLYILANKHLPQWYVSVQVSDTYYSRYVDLNFGINKVMITGVAKKLPLTKSISVERVIVRTETDLYDKDNTYEGSMIIINPESKEGQIQESFYIIIVTLIVGIIFASMVGTVIGYKLAKRSRL